MKLNNRGWGTKELIISCCIILILLLIVVFNVNRLYNSIEKSFNTPTTSSKKVNNTTNNNNNNNTDNNSSSNNDNYTYDDQNNNNNNNNNTTSSDYNLEEIDLEYYKNSEARLKEATRKYIIDTNLPISDIGETVDISVLKNSSYITDIHDIYDSSVCTGYSYVTLNTDSSISIQPFISCTSYTTEGY